MDAGRAASGIYDLRSVIYNAPSGGDVVSTPITNSLVDVTNGLFAVTLDFGGGAFTGGARWLELSVRTNDTKSFVPLSPRQALTPAPYAVYSAVAGSAVNLSGTLPVAQLTGMLSIAQICGVGSAASSNAAAFYSSANPSNYITKTATIKRFNVMEYGASGVGIAGLDSPAFKAAWNDAFKHGGVVYAPRGLYVDTNSYSVPVWPAYGPHSMQGGSEIFIEGDGREATFICVATTDPAYLQCHGQIPGIKELTFQNIGSRAVSCLVATNTPGVAGILHNAAFRGFYKGADIGAHDGLRVTSCEFYDCYIGLRLAGFSDGVIVEARADACRAGVVIGGFLPSQGYSKAQGGRFHLEGNGNGFHFVVARSGGNVLSGYTEHNTNAVVAIGYPPGLLPGETYAETQPVPQLNIESLLEGVPINPTNDFVRLYVPVTALRISGCYGGTLIHSTTASADAHSAWIAEGNAHSGNMVIFSDGRTIEGDGVASNFKTWSYRWSQIHQYSTTSGTFVGSFVGDGVGLSTLSPDAILGALTTNLAVLAPGGRTNTLCFTNGVLRAVR